jgi:hypothetical protein
MALTFKKQLLAKQNKGLLRRLKRLQDEEEEAERQTPIFKNEARNSEQNTGSSDGGLNDFNSNTYTNNLKRPTQQQTQDNDNNKKPKLTNEESTKKNNLLSLTSQPPSDLKQIARSVEKPEPPSIL